MEKTPLLLRCLRTFFWVNITLSCLGLFAICRANFAGDRVRVAYHPDQEEVAAKQPSPPVEGVRDHHHEHGSHEVANMAANCNGEMSESEVITMIHDRYAASRKRPSETGSTVVQVEIHVQGISEISETTASFETDILFSQLWLDRNLNFSSFGFCKKNITLGANFLHKVWTPNTCIVNTKHSNIHKSPTENLFVILYKNGTVWVNYRIKASGPCDLDLRMFPFDTQTCNLAFESYSYNNEEVQLTWFPVALTFFPNAVQLPDFVLADWNTSKTTPTYPNGQWDRLEISFTFKRRSAFYILQAYIPTYIIIATSWISFCMDHKILPARTTITVSALLAITFQYGNIIKSLPKVSYIKAMDVWMLACVSFVFAALIELAIISIISRRMASKNSFATPAHIAPPPPTSEPSQGSLPKTPRYLSLVPGTDETLRPMYMTSGAVPTYSNGLPHACSSTAAEVVQYNRSNSITRDFLALRYRALRRRERRKRCSSWFRCLCCWCCCCFPCGPCGGCGSSRRNRGRMRSDCTPRKIDQFCVVAFPAIFVAFNIGYWAYYLSMTMGQGIRDPDAEHGPPMPAENARGHQEI